MAQVFALEAVFAGKGDSLILHCGTTNMPRWVLIDGGHKDVYAKYLRPRLDELRIEHATRARNGKLPLDLVIVSHSDEDHLMGLLDLKRHMEEEAQEPLDVAPVDISQLWLNGFDRIAFGDEERTVDASRVEALVVDSASGTRPAGGLSESALRDDRLTSVIASTRQGQDLRVFARARHIDLNRQFKGGLVRRDAPGFDARRFRPVPGLQVTVLGPDQQRIERLRRKWRDDLEKAAKSKDARATAFDDSSVHNLASIMVLVERGGKTMLLTGDGRGDHLVEGLKAQRLLSANQPSMHVDLFKVPHHGSSRNVKQETFERIQADHYVISANGEHDNPDPEMLSMLANGRKVAGLDDDYHVHFTFPDRAFALISDEAAIKSPKRHKQREALRAVNDWLISDRPKEFVPVFREPNAFSVTIDLL